MNYGDQLNKFLSIMVFHVMYGAGVFCQEPVSSSVISRQLTAIYKVYDSMSYISFDMRIITDADTAGGFTGQHDEQKAKLTVAGKKYRYELGENIFMQGDSFLIAVYKPAKTLLLDRAKPGGANRILPGGGSSLDSLMATYDSAYTMFTDSTQNRTRLLLLHTTLTSMPYRDITIEYDAEKSYLISTTYVYYTPQNSPSVNHVAVTQKHTLTIYYENYRFDTRGFGKVFSEAEFIYYNGEKYWPSDAYRNYQFYDMVNQ